MNKQAEIDRLAQRLETDPTADGGQTYLKWQRLAGNFDPANKGLWQERYVREYFKTLGGDVQSLRVLDFGTGMGSNLSAMIDAGADAWGCEILPLYVRTSPFENVRGRLIEADVRDMWMFADGIFDVLHSSQVLEHLQTDTVDQALEELFRVAAPGARLLCSFCCEPGSDPKLDDPTHFTVEPEIWWEGKAADAGWEPLPNLRERYRQSPMAEELYPYWGILALGKSDDTDE